MLNWAGDVHHVWVLPFIPRAHNIWIIFAIALFMSRFCYMNECPHLQQFSVVFTVFILVIMIHKSNCSDIIDIKRKWMLAVDRSRFLGDRDAIIVCFECTENKAYSFFFISRSLDNIKVRNGTKIKWTTYETHIKSRCGRKLKKGVSGTK